MALFQKKPQATDSIPLYTLGSHRTVLIIGLGNPEAKYSDTRHNVGFMALDLFAQQNDFPAWINKNDLKCQISIANLGENRVILAKPQTYMNASGAAAQALQHFYKISNAQTLAVYDEAAIKFGQLRTRVGGSDAGHNGVKSLIDHIGVDFSRIRIGINSELAVQADQSAFVLGKFTKEEQAKLLTLLNETAVLLTEFIFGGELKPETRSIE